VQGAPGIAKVSGQEVAMNNTYVVRFFYNGKNMQLTVSAVSEVDAMITVERMFPGANVHSAVLQYRIRSTGISDGQRRQATEGSRDRRRWREALTGGVGPASGAGKESD
jgi:hypothetical protein